MKAYFFSLVFFLLVSPFVAGGDFEVSIPVVKSIVKQGEIIKHSVNILNLDEGQEFNVNVASGVGFISIEDGLFILNEEESGLFNVVLDARDLNEGVYVGKVSISDQEESQNLPVIFEVESAEINIDVSSEISPRFSRVVKGDKLEVDVNIYNFRSSTGEVSLSYLIRNLAGNIIVSEDQDLIVANQIQITKIFEIPEDLDVGDYLFSIVATSDGSIGTSAALFGVSEEIALIQGNEKNKDYFFFVFSSIIVLLIASFLFFNYYWNKRVVDTAKHWNQKLVDVRKVKLGTEAKEIHKLEYKKKLLEKAYEKGYVKNVSYLEGRKRINEAIRKLKKRL